MFAVSHETLVAHAVNRGVCRAHPDHRMGSPLPRGPGELEQMQPALVPYLAADGVRGLGDRVAVQRAEVVVFDKDIVRSVIQLEQRFIRLPFLTS